jgi:hypothetical protein
LHRGTPSAWSSYLYVNSHYTQKYYEFAVVSSKNVCQTRLTPTLRHKEQ